MLASKAAKEMRSPQWGVYFKKIFFEKGIAMKQTVRRQGFTLIEVLIVVVIIGLLATLIIPRFLSTAKRAKTAEALQMLGAMQRAASNYQDLGGNSFKLSELSLPADWEKIGMNKPVSKIWVYQMSLGSAGNLGLYAIYIDDGLGGGGYGTGGNTYMKLSIKSTGSKTWSCDAGMQPLYSSSDPGVPIGCQF